MTDDMTDDMTNDMTDDMTNDMTEHNISSKQSHLAGWVSQVVSAALWSVSETTLHMIDGEPAMVVSTSKRCHNVQARLLQLLHFSAC